MADEHDDELARHTAWTLAAAQAFGGASPAIVVSLGGLVGEALSPDRALVTLPVTSLHIGLALGTIPAALLMSRYGRRSAYFLGAVIGAVSGSVAAVGIVLGSFALFCAGTFMAGLFASFVNSYRFAAADTASPGYRNRAITLVMLGGIAAAIIGPQTVIWTRDLVPGAAFAGGFLGQAGLALVSILILANLRHVPPPTRSGPYAGRPLGVIVRQRRFVLAVTAALVSFGLMSLVMTAAPVAMVVECGLSVNAATLGIQWHILAMYGPSLVTGRLMDRFGKERVTVAGLVLIAAAALVGLSGRDVGHFWAALVLLGVGWNFGFVGATALVTDCYRPEERARVQAANDFLVFGTVALASLSSGSILNAAGWQAVNWVVLPPVALVLALFAANALATRRAARLAT